MLEKLTCADFSAVAISIRRSLDEHKLALPPDSDLVRIVELFSWVGSFSGDPFVETGPRSIDGRRLGEALVRLEQVRILASVLERVAQIDGTGSLLRWFRTRLDREKSINEPSQDFLWELEVASRLANRFKWVSMEEPDIVVRLDGSRAFSVACKRPRNKKSIGGAIRKGARQVSHAGLPGLVVISIDPLIYHPDGGRRVYFTTPDQSSLAREADSLVASVVREASSAIAAAFRHESVRGVILCSFVAAICAQPSSFVWRWCLHPIPNLAADPSGKLVEIVRAVLSERPQLASAAPGGTGDGPPSPVS